MPRWPHPLLAQFSEANNPAIIQVTLSYPFSQPITVDVVTIAGTATSPEDFISATTSVTFPANVTAQNVPITLTNDGAEELNEQFTVHLTNASVPNLGDDATVTIVDDDTPPTFTFAQTAYNILESAGPLRVVVTMGQPPPEVTIRQPAAPCPFLPAQRPSPSRSPSSTTAMPNKTKPLRCN